MKHFKFIYMKKIALLFLVILFTASCSLQAQKTFTGEITYKMSLEGTDDPNLIAGFESITPIITILGNKSKTVIKPNESFAITQTWDGDKGTSSVVVEITGMGKYFKKMDAEQVKNKIKFNDYKYRYENEFLDILGYKCQKVNVTITNLEDDTQTEKILYVTKDIGTAKLNGEEYPNLEGYPLRIVSSSKMLCEECEEVIFATKITPKKIKPVDFLLPSDAKNIEEAPELKEMLKGLFGEE